MLNNSELAINNSFVQECSIIGSANKSSTLFPISSGAIDEDIKKPTTFHSQLLYIPARLNMFEKCSNLSELQMIHDEEKMLNVLPIFFFS